MLKKIKENQFYIILLFVLMIFSSVYYVILKKEKFEEDVSGYLTYVPLTYEYNINTDKDAYSGDPISIDDMRMETLLKHVFYQVEPLKYNMMFESDNCLGNTCFGKRTEKISEVKKIMKKYYNIKDVDVDSFDVPIGTVFRHDKYFVEIDFERRGNYPVKYSEVIKFEKTNNKLIIYEKAGFYIKHSNSDEKPTIHSNTTDEAIVTELTNLESPAEEGQEYYNNNKNKFKTFKHTFKLNKKHEYYYYKTEQVK